MDEQSEQQLMHEIDSISLTCDMQHPHPETRISVPCEEPAAWFATVHDCRKKRDYPNNGTTLPICDAYVEHIKKMEFPYRCPGCMQEITSLISLIWEIRRL